MLVLIGGCIQSVSENEDISEIKFNYDVGGCDIEKETQFFSLPNVAEPIISVSDDKIIINHLFNYVCCADIKLDYVISDNLIKIYESNIGEMCFCLCDYNINADIGPFPKGEYEIEIYGIDYEMDKGALLLAKKVDIK